MKQNLSEKKLSECDEEELYVAWAQTKLQRKKELEKQQQDFNSFTNLFIRSIDGKQGEAEVKKAFSKYGKITSLRLNNSK